MIAESYFAFVSTGEWDKDRIIWRDHVGLAPGIFVVCRMHVPRMFGIKCCMFGFRCTQTSRTELYFTTTVHSNDSMTPTRGTHLHFCCCRETIIWSWYKAQRITWTCHMRFIICTMSLLRQDGMYNASCISSSLSHKVETIATKTYKSDFSQERNCGNSKL